MSRLILAEGLAAETPATNKVVIYAKTDGKIYAKDDAGTEFLLGAASGGSGLTLEEVQDAVAAMVAGSTIVSFTYDDVNGTLVATLAASGVTAGTYGSATQVAQVTVGADGRVTSVANVAISGSGGLDAEGVQDVVGAMLTDSAEIDFTYDDGTGTETAVLKTSGVSAGTYGSATQVPVFAVDSKGRVTSVTNTTITGGGGGLDAEGVQDVVGGMMTGSSDTYFDYDDFNNHLQALLTTTGVTAGTYGSATQVPVFIVDSKGRVTSVTNTTITGGGASSPLTTKGDIWGFSTVDARVPVGSNGQMLVADSTIGIGVKWQAPTGAAASSTFGSATQVAQITTDANGRISGISNVAISATNPLTTKGDLFTYTTAAARLPVGSNDQVLIADSTQATGLRWGSVGGTGTVTSVAVSGGATGLTTSGGPITGSGTITIGGILGYASGGTGGTSRQEGINNLVDKANSVQGRVLRDNGTNATMAALQAGDYPAMVGDSGSGGTRGAVPAPASGDAAAGKFLKADGTWTAPPGGTSAPAAGMVKSNGSILQTAVAGTDYPSVASVTAVAADVAVIQARDYTFRNKLINGNFDFWQRGTSQATSGYGSADRWNCGNNGTTKTASQQSFTLGQTAVPGEPAYYMRHAVTSVAGAGNNCVAFQPIESVRTLAGKTATLTFWAKADANKNIAIEFRQIFGTGGSPSASVDGIGVTTCALTTSWQKFTVNVSIPSISGKTLGTSGNDQLQLFFWFDAGSTWNSRSNSLGQQSGTFDIAQVQVEEGTVATPFEERPRQVEIALCQRYYEKSYSLNIIPGTGSAAGAIFGIASSAGAIWLSTPFKITKRAVPTVVIYSPQTGASGYLHSPDNDRAGTSSYIGQNGCLIHHTETVTANNGCMAHYTADAEL